MTTLRKKVAADIERGTGLRQLPSMMLIIDATIAAVFDHLAKPSEKMVEAGRHALFDDSGDMRVTSDIWLAMLATAHEEVDR